MSDPWRCLKCGKLHTAATEFCPKKGTHWQKAYDRNYIHVPNPQPQREVSASKYRTDWGWDQSWTGDQDSQKQRPKKPKRQEAPSPRPKNPNSPRNKESKGKGKGKGKDKAPYPPEPNWEWEQPDSRARPLPAPPPLPAPSQAEEQLKHLVAKLQKEENLSPEVQNLLHSTITTTSQDATRMMHAAVTRLGHAKKAVQETQSTRLSLHQKWRAFIEDGITRWQKYAQDFNQQDQGLLETLNKSKEDLREAQSNLENTKERVHAEGPSLVDEDDIGDEPFISDSGALLQGHAQMMVDTLNALKQKVDESYQLEERNAKQAKADFVTTWQARESAVDLSWSLGHSWSPPTTSPSDPPQFSAKNRARIGQRVRFDDQLELYFGLDSSLTMAKMVLQHEAICDWTCKPWRMSFQNCSAVDAPILDVGASNSAFSTGRSHVDPQYDTVCISRFSPESSDSQESDVTTFLAHIPRPEPRIIPHGPQPPVLPGAHLHDEEPADPTETDDSDGEGHWQSVHMFRLGAPFHAARVRWDSFEDLHRDVCRVTGIHHRDLLNIFEVEVPPQDLDRAGIAPIILRRSQDLRNGDGHQMALVDLQIHEHWPSLNYEVTRLLRILPPQLMRQTLLDFLGVGPYCRRVRQRCLVQQNRQLVALNDEKLIEVRHGDYLLVIVPPQPRICELPTRNAILYASEEVPVRRYRQRYQAYPNDPRRDHFPSTLQRLDTATPGVEVDDSGFLQTDSGSLRKNQGIQTDHIGEDDVLPSGSISTCARDPLQFAPEDDLPEPLAADSPSHSEVDEDTVPDDEVAPQPEEERHRLAFSVWYLRGVLHPHCDVPRVIRPRSLSNVHMEIAIRQVWGNYIDPARPLQIHAVRPSPPRTAGMEPMPHIIALQDAPIETRGILLALMREDDLVQLRAVFGPAHITRFDLVVLLGQEHDCYTAHLQNQCLVHAGDLLIDPEAHYWSEHGKSFVISVKQRRGQHIEPPSTDDAGVFWEDDDEGPILMILRSAHRLHFPTRLVFPTHTWFVDHQGPLHCRESRLAALGPDEHLWAPALKQIWADVLRPGVPLRVHRVAPHPAYHSAVPAAEHIILTQSDTIVPERRAIMINVARGWDDYNIVASLVTPAMTEQIIWHADGFDFCGPGHRDWQCVLKRNALTLSPGEYTFVQNGECLQLVADRRIAYEDDDSDEDMTEHVQTRDQGTQTEETTFLQKSRPSSLARLIVDTVAHGPQPSDKRVLHLNDHLSWPELSPADEQIGTQCPPIAVTVLNYTGFIAFPSFLDVQHPGGEFEVQQALLEFGFNVLVCQCGNTDRYACFCRPAVGEFAKHYVYGPQNPAAVSEIFVHTSAHVLKTKDHMQLLYQMGFTRAVIVSEDHQYDPFIKIIFHNNIPEMEQQQASRAPTPWPARQPSCPYALGFHYERLTEEAPEHLLDMGFPLHKWKEFFASGDGILCQETAHLPLHDATKHALSLCVELAPHQIDRYLIFTDGTSHGWARRKNPLEMEEQGHGDAWAFVVIGERYVNDLHSEFAFLGWHSQRVIYSPDESHFMGTSRIGAEAAEKEALTWAAIWRLSQNHRVPTTFCVDSTSTAYQADGSFGTDDPNPCYCTMRGAFQALEELLPGSCLQVHHVRSHTGDPWNEMADTLAKEEARHGHRLPRQNLDFRQWRPLLPYMWMMYAVDKGAISDEQIAFLAHRMNLGTDVLSDLSRILQAPSALDMAHMPPLDQNYIRSLHCDTWFYMGDDPNHRRVVTTIGTRPGDSFADVIFGYAWSRILASVETQLISQGLLCAYPDVHGMTDSPDEPAGPAQPFFGPTWMDDTCASAFGCMLCQKRCKTLGGQGAHMFRVHGHVSTLRLLFDGTSCPWCLKEYHSASRLKAHLRTVEVCRVGLQARGQLFSPAPGAGSTEDRQRLRQHDGLVPVLQAAGPLLPAAQGPLWDQHDPDLSDQLAICFLDHEDLHNIEEAMRQVIVQRPVSWTMCQTTLAHLRQTLTEEDALATEFSLADLRALCASLACASSWPFLSSSTGTCTSPSTRIASLTFYDCEDWCVQAVHSPHPSPAALRVPRPFSKERILLHAFAGRRRLGDVQWFLDAAPLPDSTILITVSLDLVINAEWGDISRPATKKYWLTAIRSGQVLGFMCGPPCNTWSRARGVALEGPGNYHAPRVLRHDTTPWGDRSLSIRELWQITEANLLLGFAIEAFLLIALCHGVGVLEHPAAPEEPELVSIWKLPLIQVILGLPGVELLSFTQGKLGAPSPKPTMLMTAHLPGLRQDLQAWQLTPHDPRQGMIGKDSKGGFHTAPLKEYPPAMCMALATAFQRAFAQTPLAEAPLESAFLDRCQSMAVTELGSFIGPDSAGP
eukprot:Skav224656  [mRNA]  locus=scaffold4300:194197:204539:- [translate_table: standard]